MLAATCTCMCVCVLDLGYINRMGVKRGERRTYKQSQKLWSVGGSCQRHCAQLPRHQLRSSLE